MLGIVKAYSSKRIADYIHEVQQMLFYVNAELAFNPDFVHGVEAAL